MTTLTSLRLKALHLRANEAEADFIAACCAAGYAGQFSAYRAEEAGAVWTPALVAVHAAYIEALHAFYLARDGERGFLGGRGL